MRPIRGYKDVQASGEFERLAPGGYVIRITEVIDEDAPDKQYLRIIYDIAEGPEAGRYKNETPENFYRHQFIRSYKEKALPMLKAFTVAIDETNGTKYTDQIEKGFDEKQLVGKLLGVVFGYEEYAATDGNVKERLRVATVMSADRIRRGDFKVPELKRLDVTTQNEPPTVPGFEPITDADIPF